MGSGIKGFKSQKILKQKLNGYSENDSIDIERYATIQELTGDKYGIDTVIHGSFKVNTIVKTAGAGSNIRTLKSVAHEAIKGDHIRFTDDGIEASVLSVPDIDTIILGSELSFDPTGLNFDILRHITPAYNADGSLNVSVIPSAVAYDRKQAGITTATTVLEDLDTPAASRPMPVAIHSIDGAGITVNAGDLSVSTSHVNDSMAIGDGARLVQTTTNNELKTRDNDAITKMGDGTQKTQITDGAGTVTTKQIGTAITASDVGLITNTVIHGLSSGGGGTYVDVKVTPSGAIIADVTSTNLDIRDLVFATDKVDVSGSSITVSSTNLDIRDLSFATDKVDVSGSSITVSSTNLDIRDLAFATDKVDVSGSSVTVSATNLDIRDLAFATDKVDVSGSSVSITGTVPVAVSANDAKYAESNVINTTASAILSSVTAKKVYIQALDTNTANLRVKITTTGASASTTSGWQLQPGRSDSFELGGGSLNCTVSVCSESGSGQSVVVQYA